MTDIKTQSAHKFWLRISAIVIGFFGPIPTLGTYPATIELARLGLDILTWPIDGFPDYKSEEIRFLSDLTRGFLVGWAATVWCLSNVAYDHAPGAVRKSVVAGTCAWFSLGSVGSVVSGQWPNTSWNMFVLILVFGPMWRPAHRQPALPK